MNLVRLAGFALLGVFAHYALHPDGADGVVNFVAVLALAIGVAMIAYGEGS